MGVQKIEFQCSNCEQWFEVLRMISNKKGTWICKGCAS